MAKKCDHKSVGVIVIKNGKMLLIERKRPPFGFAPPAGHLDSDSSFKKAARRELLEEVGLTATKLKLIAKGRKENPCRREGGTWHYWEIYKAEVEGEVKSSPDEVKRSVWLEEEEIEELMEKTKKFLQGDISQEDWGQSPGIEPVWCEWFLETHLIWPKTAN